MKDEIFRRTGHLPLPLRDLRPWLAALVAVAGLGAGAPHASARQPAFDELPPTIERPARESKRSELRRALISTHETGDAAPVRRRLSDEERSALHRDLRDAMRGAYPDAPRGRRSR